MTKWDLIKDYINSNKIITRKELKLNGLEGNTVDNYINQLQNSKFIKRTYRGQYERISKIPDFLTSNMLTIVAYDNIKRIKLFRKLKLEEIKKASF